MSWVGRRKENSERKKEFPEQKKNFSVKNGQIYNSEALYDSLTLLSLPFGCSLVVNLLNLISKVMGSNPNGG